jgi:hypothetical protein
MAKFWYKPAYHLTEREVRYAISCTNSNADAANFLHISNHTWKKYAQMYFDSETGKTLYDIHKNKGSKAGKKPPNVSTASMEDIFAGKHPKYNTNKLHFRLINEGHLEEKCSMCGFCERRMSDYKVPLILTWKNGNKKDHSKSNLELVCYNCYALYYGELKQGGYIIVGND